MAAKNLKGGGIMERFKGKVAILTGGAQGIEEAIARHQRQATLLVRP